MLRYDTEKEFAKKMKKQKCGIVRDLLDCFVLN